MPPLTEPITPELALVSPELSASARAALPDRPWEMFLPGGPVEMLPLSPALRAPRSETRLESADAPPSGRRRRVRVPLAPLVLLGFVGLVAAGSILPPRDAPSLSQARAGTSPRQPTGAPASGYAFTNGKGFLHIDGGGRSIVELQAVLPCAGTVVLRSIAVAPDGLFHAQQQVGLDAPVSVEVDGTVDSPATVSGSVRVTEGPCRGSVLRFAGRRT